MAETYVEKRPAVFIMIVKIGLTFRDHCQYIFEPALIRQLKHLGAAWEDVVDRQGGDTRETASEELGLAH